MGNTVADAADALARALDAPGWLALGVLLHLANQVARGRGWWAVLRPAAGHDPAPRRRPRPRPAPPRRGGRLDGRRRRGRSDARPRRRRRADPAAAAPRAEGAG